MIQRRSIAVVVTLVALAALLLAGTTYARALVVVDPEGELPTGCGGQTMGDMHTTMWGSLAASLEMSAEELREAVAGGESLIELAKAQGLTPDQLAEKMLAAMDAALKEQVAEGNLTSDEASSMLQAARGHMTPEHLASMGDVTGHMGGSSIDGIDMNAMHESMHGAGSGFDMDSTNDMMGGKDGSGAGSCHGDDGEETGNPGPSMMGGMF